MGAFLFQLFLKNYTRKHNDGNCVDAKYGDISWFNKLWIAV